MLPTQTVGDLKRAIALPLSMPVEEQRLFARSCLLQDFKQLGELGLDPECPAVMLVPTLTHRAAGGVAPINARRGFNMVPGNTPWRPSKHAQIGQSDLKMFFDDGPPVRHDPLFSLTDHPALRHGLDPTKQPPDEALLLQRSF